MSVTDGTVLKAVVSMLWTDAEVAQNVYNLVITGGSAPYAEADVVSDVIDYIDNLYLQLTSHVSDNLDGNTVYVYEYDAVDDDWDEIGSDMFVWNPSQTAENLPRPCSGLVRLWTTDPDVQGKKYLPGFSETAAVDGLLSGTILTAMTNFGGEWWDPVVGAATGATLTPGVWSVVGKVFKAAIEHYAVNAIVAYQRRRKRNVGI